LITDVSRSGGVVEVVVDVVDVVEVEVIEVMVVVGTSAATLHAVTANASATNLATVDRIESILRRRSGLAGISR
jgi:hypothetical protein